MTTGHLRAHRVFLAPVLLMIALVACGGGGKELSAEEKRAQAIAEGNVALCNNGDFSNNTDFGKTCSGADGLDEWLAEYGECNDGTTIKMAKNSSCGGSGFKELKEAGFKPTPKADDVALCNNGMFSNNTDFSATCSGGGGIDRWLAEYGECNDGTVIVMGASASCSDRDGFKGLKPEGFRPAPKADDVALCKSGTYSNNTDFAATCNGGGGIDRWLAEYGECNDGTIIKMGASASCRDHDGFKELKPDGFVPPTTTTTTTTAPATTTSLAAAEPTPAEVEAAFTAYLDQRASSGVLIAKAVQSVVFENGTLRVTFDPEAAGIDRELFLSVNPFDNMAEFVGTPIAFANEEGARLRTVVERVSTQLSDGTDLGSLTAAEIYEIGTGEKLPE